MVHLAGRSLAIAATVLLLAACGGKKEAAAGNDVEMRDMEVVDGTANDSMTDLDAVQADGVGSGDNAGNAAAARPTPAASPEAAGEDAEAVASE